MHRIRPLTTQIINNCINRNKELKWLGVKENKIILSPWHFISVLELEESKINIVCEEMLKDERLKPRETAHTFPVFEFIE